MRLLNVLSLHFEDFWCDGSTPEYAILSHIWSAEEVSFEDVQEGKPQEPGSSWTKLLWVCQQAKEDSYDYAWIDTCCIDRKSSAELSEAVNAMFNWYKNAAICYVYLDDVEIHETGQVKDQSVQDRIRESKWFTRGWTLQELVAPRHFNFFSRSWTPLGGMRELKCLARHATGIDNAVLEHLVPLVEIDVRTKISWVKGRKTRRPEDLAYSFLGIFDVNMPILYGEGIRAIFRLQEEILKVLWPQAIGCRTVSVAQYLSTSFESEWTGSYNACEETKAPQIWDKFTSFLTDVRLCCARSVVRSNSRDWHARGDAAWCACSTGHNCTHILHTLGHCTREGKVFGEPAEQNMLPLCSLDGEVQSSNFQNAAACAQASENGILRAAFGYTNPYHGCCESDFQARIGSRARPSYENTKRIADPIGNTDAQSLEATSDAPFQSLSSLDTTVGAYYDLPKLGPTINENENNFDIIFGMDSDLLLLTTSDIGDIWDKPAKDSSYFSTPESNTSLNDTCLSIPVGGYERYKRPMPSTGEQPAKKLRPNRSQCDMCPRTFTRESDLHRHYADIHGQTSKYYSCSICGHWSNRKDKVMSRCRRKHGVEAHQVVSYEPGDSGPSKPLSPLQSLHRREQNVV